MKYTHSMHFLPRSLHALSLAALVWGIGLTTAHTMIFASLTSPGSTLLDRLLPGQELHAAAVISTGFDRAEAGIQLVLGILFIVLGFFLHALARMRNGERPVHITVKPGKRRRMWFWVEMHV